jgi:DNA-binding MarR family transcriptional regulator
MSKKEPFLQDLLPYLLQRSSYLVTRRFHRTLQLSGVSVSRWRMLVCLFENEPYTVNQLAEQLMLRQPSVTILVDNGVNDGLLKKNSDPADGRRVQVRLSKAGHKLAESLKVEARQAEADFIRSIGHTQV